MDYLRYEMMKISGRKCFYLHSGNYEFKKCGLIEYRKTFEKDSVIKRKFSLNKLRRNIVSIKSQFVWEENERKKKWEVEERKKEGKKGGKCEEKDN